MKVNLKVILIAIIVVILCQNVYSTNYNKECNQWVDSVMSTLTPKERIAQLFMIRVYSNKDSNYTKSLVEIVKKYNIGGLCFFQGGPVRQANITNIVQANAKTPLFIAIDAEWGLGMRLDSCLSFPKQMTLGAISENDEIYSMGAEIAKQLKRIGVHFNFAPSCDINSNPKNPVIGARSFGEDNKNVAQKAYKYMKGMQDNGIFAFAKHFPGHGDTDSDSHFTLPRINKDMEQLSDIELYPFQYLIDKKIKGVMIGHLHVPAIDHNENSITSISKNTINGLLGERMGFSGITITDGMDMKGVTGFVKNPKLLEVMAFKAGNDIFLLPANIDSAINNVKNAIDSGFISQYEIDVVCRKLLKYKYELGLNNFKLIELENINKDINNNYALGLIQSLYNQSITMLEDKDDLIPIKRLDTLNIASIVVGSQHITPFQKMIENYCKVTHFNITSNPKPKHLRDINEKLKNFNLLIIGIVNTSDLPSKNFNISKDIVNWIDSLSINNNIVLDLFSSPYAVDYFANINSLKVLLVSYQDNEIAQEVSAQSIFGAKTIRGKLPVTINDKYKIGAGKKQKHIVRLGYSTPELKGVSSKELLKIDSIILQAINLKAFPGCQILAARSGDIFYNKSFGTLAYDTQVVTNKTVYDLASLTKILSTTLAIAKLEEVGFIQIDEKLGNYLPELKNSDKGMISIRELMAHQAGFEPYIPFFKQLNPKWLSLSNYKNVEYPFSVAQNLYSSHQVSNFIFNSIISQPLSKSKVYKYSDLGFILLGKLIETTAKTSINKFVAKEFYNKLGLSTICFNPIDNFDKKIIAPTELDTLYRKQLLCGYVHDPTAALLGGIAGHAGLFSNSHDVAVIMQMLLNNGKYGDEQLVSEKIMGEYTKTQYKHNNNRRGIGFDKPAFKKNNLSPTCESASHSSFGHSGFTGTYAWADPAEELVFVFLSNRVYPDANNMKINILNIRTNINQILYDAIIK